MTFRVCIAQPVINERYTLNDESNAIFSTVLVINDKYFVSGFQSSLAGFKDNESSLSFINFGSVLDSIKIYRNDSLGLSFMSQTKMIITLDSNLAHVALAASVDYPYSYFFIKMNKQGEVLNINYFPEFYTEDSNEGKNPSTLIQSADSTYYGIVHVQHSENYLVGFTFFRLDKYGNLMVKKSYYGDDIEEYNALASASMVQLNANELMIGCAYRKDAFETEDRRHHTRLMKIDTLGELIEEVTYWEDRLSFDCNSLTKTTEGGFLYCGRIGEYLPETDSRQYNVRIVKINADYSIDWEFRYGLPVSLPYSNLTKILPLNDSEFVAVGFTPGEGGILGCLLKFNIAGELLWHRKYMKVPPLGDGGEHQLYDVELTPDGGFVMVGQANDRLGYTDLPGQKAWLVKTDEYGCLVPGCEDDDLGIDNPVKTIQSKIYPNPAQNTLFYYHHQDNFEPATITIHSINGKKVHEWQLNTNDITCEVDISHFQSGVYVLNAVNAKGEVLSSEKFIVE